MRELFLKGFEIKGPTIQSMQMRKDQPIMMKSTEWLQRRQMRRNPLSGKK